MWTKTFWLKTIEWTIKAAAAAAVAFLTANASGILDVDLKHAVSVVGLATVVTFFTCIAGNGLGDKGTPSVVKAEETTKELPYIGTPTELTPPTDNYDTTGLEVSTTKELPYIGTPTELTPPTDNYDTTGLEVSTTKQPTYPAVEFPQNVEETNIVKGTE